MILTETRKLIVRLLLVSLCATLANGCNSNQKLYTEIGCKPVYGNDSNSCPVAYNCENVFTRPTTSCYFNGNVYEPVTMLSKADLAINPCLTCFCDQRTYDDVTTIKFTCINKECQSDYTPSTEPCYNQYDRDSCCSVRKYCPEENALVHECVYNGNVYKNGQRIYFGDDQPCICSPEFNGTFSDPSCRQLNCKYELLHMENILRRSAPVYYENVDGCPVEWYHPENNAGTVDVTTAGKSSGPECKYGDQSLSIGQQLIVSQQSDFYTYTTTCSCNIPPLVTCVKTVK